MKLIFEPKVRLIAQMKLNGAELDSFLEDMDSDYWPSTETPDCLPEIAGRLCYMSYDNPRPGGNKAYLDHIKEVGHGSVLESAVFSFIIEGVSRSLSHELVRHRAGMSFSQLSQRFVDESVAEYVVPPLLIDDVRQAVCPTSRDDSLSYSTFWLDPEHFFLNESSTNSGSIWIRGVIKAHRDYCNLACSLLDGMPNLPDRIARRKAAREAARSVLPNATETKLYVTGNARAWRHFIEMRASRFADAEIRRLAIVILKILQEASPNLFSDYTISTLEDGTEEATTPWRKV